jgi:hypothetical protein
VDIHVEIDLVDAGLLAPVSGPLVPAAVAKLDVADSREVEAAPLAARRQA